MKVVRAIAYIPAVALVAWIALHAHISTIHDAQSAAFVIGGACVAWTWAMERRFKLLNAQITKLHETAQCLAERLAAIERSCSSKQTISEPDGDPGTSADRHECDTVGIIAAILIGAQMSTSAYQKRIKMLENRRQDIAFRRISAAVGLSASAEDRRKHAQLLDDAAEDADDAINETDFRHPAARRHYIAMARGICHDLIAYDQNYSDFMFGAEIRRKEKIDKRIARRAPEAAADQGDDQ